MNLSNSYAVVSDLCLQKCESKTMRWSQQTDSTPHLSRIGRWCNRQLSGMWKRLFVPIESKMKSMRWVWDFATSAAAFLPKRRSWHILGDHNLLVGHLRQFLLNNQCAPFLAYFLIFGRKYNWWRLISLFIWYRQLTNQRTYNDSITAYTKHGCLKQILCSLIMLCSTQLRKTWLISLRIWNKIIGRCFSEYCYNRST